jgi:LPS export ABC transporter protein LptC
MSWFSGKQWLKRRSPRQRVAVLLFLLLISAELLRHTHTTTALPIGNTTTLPQEYMKAVKLTIFDTQGAIKNALSAEYWAYSPQTEHSVLNKPKLVIYKPDHSIWEIVAKHAKVNQPNIGAIESIVLSQDVVLQSSQATTAHAAHTAQVTVETQSLDYQPEKQYAETAQFVKMTKPALTITGIGLRAFLETNWVELLHDVKTYYTSH